MASLLDACRLVTLTGPPGIGKTRLAEEVASASRERSWRVELAPVTDPALIPRALASAFSVAEAPGKSLGEAVLSSLRRRRGLLVLDNCEHLVAACAETVEGLLNAAPGLRILATSREALAIGIETEWRVPALAVPDRQAQDSPEALADFAAVRLFVERAQAVQPEFSLNAYVAPAVADICRGLDGLPLAIELAAACVESLTPADIAARLDDRFDLLTDGGDGDPPRHQTLLAALDWSHQLLSEPERALLRRLSVFAGGFELEAVEAICLGPELSSGELMNVLARLIGKSLAADLDSGPQSRYHLLETIRAYGSDRLEEAGEAGRLRAAHARYYLTLAEQAEPELTGPSQHLWLERLDSERENLRLALDWSLGHGYSEWALRLSGALVLFWRVRCHFSEGRRYLDAAASVGEGMPDELLAKALWGAGFMALMAGDVDGAVPAVEESLECFRRAGDLGGQARALLILGNCRQYRGDPGALLEESAALAREAGDSWCLAHALGITGFGHLADGDLEAASPPLTECLEVGRDAGDMQSVRVGLLGLATVTVHQGDYVLAEALLDEAILIVDELGEDYSRAAVLHVCGRLAFGRGEHRRARGLLEESLELAGEDGSPDSYVLPLILLADVVRADGDRDLAARLLEQASARVAPLTPIGVMLSLGELAAEDGDLGRAGRFLHNALGAARATALKDAQARALFGLGEVAREEGDATRAAVRHGEALRLRHEIGVVPQTVASIEALAGLDPPPGGEDQCAQLLGAAQALRDANGYARLPHESFRHQAAVTLIRRALGEAEFDAAWAAGANLTIGEAVDEALKGVDWRGRSCSGWTSLTEREREVAVLVAEGATNPEIAEGLHVSLSTVKAHLARIFAKLGVAGRTELAREVWRQDPDPPGASDAPTGNNGRSANGGPR